MTAHPIPLDYALPTTRRRRRWRWGAGLLAVVVLVGGYVGCWMTIQRDYVDFVWWGPDHNMEVGWEIDHPLVHSRVAKVIFTPAHWIDLQRRPEAWPAPKPNLVWVLAND